MSTDEGGRVDLDRDRGSVCRSCHMAEREPAPADAEGLSCRGCV